MRSKTFSVEVRSGWTAVVAIFALILIAAGTASSQEKLVYSFYNVSGVLPEAGVVSDASGNLYGTSFYGGAHGQGMVYELTSAATGWKQTVLHSFDPNSLDGFGPTAGVIFDASGNIYGTTEFGGSGSCTVGFGCGTVFELSPSASGWKETILHDFVGTDGWQVHAGLVRDAAGNLYGTTLNGGTYKQGTAFELSPEADGSWTLTVLYEFPGGTDAGVPSSDLIFDTAGNLYGATSEGGGTTGECKYGCGTVFELSPSTNGTWTETVLHSFTTSSADGHVPSGGLIFDTAGNLYGTAGQGGGHLNGGIVFELSPSGRGTWTETVLHNFNNKQPDGRNPSARLMFDGSGNLYSSTLTGGSLNQGTVYELSPAASGGWSETILHSFNPQNGDGYNPNSGLILLGGKLYGTTGQGGSQKQGTVFEVRP